MSIRFLSPTVHGIFDYLAALALIAAPFVLGLGKISPLVYWLSVIAGVVLILYSLLTNYSYSLAKIIPFKVHLVLDLIAGIVFVAAPFVLGLVGLAKLYCLVMGIGVILVVAITRPSVAKTSVAA